MKDIDENLTIIKDRGYIEIGHFILPEIAWWKNYYDPLEKRVQMLRKKYANDPGALAVLNEADTEISLYRKYSEWYGYVFYIMQKNK